MDSVAVIANVLGLAIGAGLNLYAAVLVTGLGIHYGWLTRLPAELNVLGHPAVLATAAVLYLAEFVADKVPFLTPFWDGVHTFIRPAGAALLAMGAARCDQCLVSNPASDLPAEFGRLGGRGRRDPRRARSRGADARRRGRLTRPGGKAFVPVTAGIIRSYDDPGCANGAGLAQSMRCA